jgi:tRNA A-37 threonylcarbamoyl transferase component Bud32
MLSPPDADLVRRERALPGLARLLDPEAFAEALDRSLPDAGVRSARTTYVAYRPGLSCLAAFSVTATGSTVDVYARTSRVNDLDRLHRAAARNAQPGPLGPGRLVWRDAVVSVFPNDTRLNQLQWLADPGRWVRLLRRQLPARPDLWNGSLRTFRYKPERRFVAQLEGSAILAPIKLKAFCRTTFGPARATATAFRSRGPLRLARCLDVWDNQRVLLFEWLPGQPLSETMPSAALDPEVICTVGASLAELHQQETPGLSPLTRQTQAATLLTLAARSAFICPWLARPLHELAVDLAAALLHWDGAECSIHGDFYAKQILVDGDRVAFLDLDRAARGDPALDLGLFVAHLERDALYGTLPPGRVEALTSSLVEGYRSAAGGLPSGIQLYTATGLFRLIVDPFRHREDAWPERTAAILERSRAILKTVPAPSLSVAVTP